MAKGKDFYGSDVTEVIARACKALSASQEELDIEVLETGSAGIFGLCKKKAHIRASLKANTAATSPRPKEEVKEKAAPPSASGAKEKSAPKAVAAKKGSEPVPDKAPAETAEKKKRPAPSKQQKKAAPAAAEVQECKEGRDKEHKENKEEKPIEPELPSEEVLVSIRDDINGLLEVMQFPSEVTVELVDASLNCRISGEHEEALVGSEGRTLDSLQYLLRKMMSSRLPERMMLSLDVGNYREQRAEDLKARALELAEQVKEDGKTQAIPALNPSERRVVHMLLQEDKSIRSRSVGEGLFKKVLIYKPGKKKKSTSGKGKGRQGGRSSGSN